MKFGYFPGCSLHSASREFDESLKAITGPLDIELAEIDDWNCCGATPAHATNHLLSVVLPARTLALAEEQGLGKVFAPCAACFSRLATVRHELGADASLHEKVNGILRRPFRNTPEILNIAILLSRLAAEIKTKTIRPLTGLKVACYYGCLLVRPSDITGADDCENPMSMESVVNATGATAVDWNRKVDCCGGALSLSRTDSVLRLGRTIIDDARAHGATAIVVACPMCHSNLDLRQEAALADQPGATPMPILFLPQVVGLALGIDAETLGLDRHFVSTTSFVGSIPARAAQTPAAAPHGGA
jgi:heterodisulfide reductase subunit B